ncbi:hypothetical protein [Flavobacterium nitratireducens]|uniref:8-oxoguanine DNA glycosylase OGG fold protein n=1 Tax=Flavobacterium nitratireducens TaxID=992289 RepID=UPI00241583BA|nr:hypothetical protein [Flavobacterium nitratireducens]
MNDVHLKYLIQIGNNDQGYVGNNSLNWGISVLGKDTNLDPFLNRQFNRYELFDYCQNQNNDNLNILIAILSWGGMRRDHGRRLFENENVILEIVGKLRNGNFETRKQAFDVFRNERKKKILPGLGIGYFTKLICFLSPNLNGYIMDQWVAKSINLLAGYHIVDITNNNWVNDNNDSSTYETFCQHIDNLAEILECSGFEAEKRIFSVGRKKGKWRNYLIQNYTTKKYGITIR